MVESYWSTPGPPGKFSTATVENITAESSANTTETGGRLAKSDTEILGAAFPGSEAHPNPLPVAGGDYTKAEVVSMRHKMLTMVVAAGDIGTAEAYWGFPNVESTEGDGQGAACSPDLTFGGAPTVAGVETDVNGNNIASPYMPNLVPPNSFSPTMDNQTAVVLDEDISGQVTNPPFMGTGHVKDPNASSQQMHEALTQNQGGDTAMPIETPISTT